MLEFVQCNKEKEWNSFWKDYKLAIPILQSYKRLLVDEQQLLLASVLCILEY